MKTELVNFTSCVGLQITVRQITVSEDGSAVSMNSVIMCIQHSDGLASISNQGFTSCFLIPHMHITHHSEMEETIRSAKARKIDQNKDSLISEEKLYMQAKQNILL